MKVVVQNGANHCLSRAEVEAMLEHFPAAWRSAADTLLLAAGDELAVVFHAKERTLCFYCPRAPSAARDRRRAVDELLVACAAIEERGSMPARLSAAERERLEVSVRPIAERCSGVLRD